MPLWRRISRLGLTATVVGLSWGLWLVFGELTSIGGAPGGSLDYQYPSYLGPLVLVVAGIGAMIGARFVREDP
jgi:hypothetical protein